MARNFVPASTQSLTPSSMTDITTAMSVGCWINPAASDPGAAFWTIFSKGKTADTEDRNYGCDYRAGPSLDFYFTSAPSTYSEYRKTVTLTGSVWSHLLWTIDWTTNPDTVTLYINSVNQSVTLFSGSNNTTPTTTATQTTRIGAQHADVAYFSGSLAEVFITRDIVTAAEAASLAAGFSPDLVLRRHTFDLYLPLIGRNSPETDPITGKTATLTNTPAAAAHPRIILPRRRRPSIGTVPPPPPETLFAQACL